MSFRALFIGLSVALIGMVGFAPDQLLTAQVVSTPKEPVLSACSRFDARHQNLFFDTTKFKRWPDVYHETVGKVITEFLEGEHTEVACLGDNLLPVVAGTHLYKLAAKLPPWQSPAALADLNRTDIAAVLMEFLRLYECALREQRYRYSVTTIRDFYEENPDAKNDPAKYLTIPQYGSGVLAQEQQIKNELEVSRTTLLRTLNIITGTSRAVPLDAELQCIQRASLDLRNGVALSANASMCLPARVWNTRDVLIPPYRP